MTHDASLPPVYLDNNATTRVAPEAVAAAVAAMTEAWGNPSSAHDLGATAGRALRGARRQVQALLGAALDQEIIFTSGGTEANATAIRSALTAAPGRREIVTSAVEHPAVLSLCDWLAAKEGVTVHRIPVDAQGRLDLAAYQAALGPKTALVTLMWANNETGTIFPVEGLAEIAHKAGALFHTDAVQAASKLAIDLKTSEIDMLSVSAHKLHAPKGTGALFVRKGVPFQPMLRGGHQERGRRAGTENVPGIAAFGTAAELALGRIADTARIARLRDRLEAGILAAVPRATVLGDRYDRLRNTSAIAFDFVEGEAILLHLNRAGIFASSGSACTSGTVEPSHVLRAMQVPFTAAFGAIRFSLSHETTETEVDRVIATLPGIVARLRAMSPFWAEVAGDLAAAS